MKKKGNKKERAVSAAISRALARVSGGISARAAAKAEKIPYRTLLRRIRQPVRRRGRPLLSVEEEAAVLGDFLKNKVQAGDAATQREIAEKVEDVLRSRGDQRKVGINYVNKLLKRHPRSDNSFRINPALGREGTAGEGRH